MLLTIDGHFSNSEAILPAFYLQFVRKAESKKDPLLRRQSVATLPLYNNKRRERLLCELDLPTKEPAKAILLSGVALIVADH